MTPLFIPPFLFLRKYASVFLLPFLLPVSFSFLQAQATPSFSGFIGKYAIELELNPGNEAEFNIVGKYRYKGKTAFLNLQGKNYVGGVMYIQESYNDEVTGEFYLAR